MTANLPSNRRGSNPSSANVQPVTVPTFGCLVPSRSNPGEQHLVAWTPVSNRANCSCEAWRATGHCYHVSLVIDATITKVPCPVCGGRVDRLVDGSAAIAACSTCEWAIIN